MSNFFKKITYILLFSLILPLNFVYASNETESIKILKNDVQIYKIQYYPNDPAVSPLSEDIDKQWGLHKTEILKAWDYTRGDTSIKIAVIDTGVDQTHEDFDPNTFVEGYDFVKNVPIKKGDDSDENGHGTLIAGIIAAKGDNKIGIAGVSWNSKIMPIRVLDGAGQGDSRAVSSGILWAVENGAKIINLSLGGIGFSRDQLLSDAIATANKKGVIVISAAGNDNSSSGDDLDLKPVFPACDDQGQNFVLGVSATDQNDQKPDFANYGSNCVDVSAPGKRILGPINHDPVTGAIAKNKYAYGSGTSLATAYVSGITALILSKNPDLSVSELRDRIILGVDKIDTLNTKSCRGKACGDKLGAGRVNALKSLNNELSTKNIPSESLVTETETGDLYWLDGSKKFPVSQLVKEQKFSTYFPSRVSKSQLQKYQVGPFLSPIDGTLVKGFSDPTVYRIHGGTKEPILYNVFIVNGWSWDDVKTVSDEALQSWVTGNFALYSDTVLVKTPKSKQLYWNYTGSMRPIASDYFQAMGLEIFPVKTVSAGDLKKLPIGSILNLKSR